MIVDGQIHGGLSHGLAPALYEEIQYDDNGNIQAAVSGLPRATSMETPNWETAKTVTPCPHHLPGAKGVGRGDRRRAAGTGERGRRRAVDLACVASTFRSRRSRSGQRCARRSHRVGRDGREEARGLTPTFTRRRASPRRRYAIRHGDRRRELSAAIRRPGAKAIVVPTARSTAGSAAGGAADCPAGSEKAPIDGHAIGAHECRQCRRAGEARRRARVSDDVPGRRVEIYLSRCSRRRVPSRSEHPGCPSLARIGNELDFEIVRAARGWASDDLLPSMPRRGGHFRGARRRWLVHSCRRGDDGCGRRRSARRRCSKRRGIRWFGRQQKEGAVSDRLCAVIGCARRSVGTREISGGPRPRWDERTGDRAQYHR